MIGNMKQKTEDNLEFLDGYEELPPDLQEKVSRVYEQGHVDDADWKGVSIAHAQASMYANFAQDLPQNRPGAKGFRSPALKKKKENDVTDNDNEKTPRKNTKKKRARVEDAEDEEEVPVAKKKKTPGRRGKKGDDRDEPDAVDEVRKPPVKGKGRPKKHTVVDEKAVSEEGGDAEDVEPPAKTTKKSRTSKMATAPAEDKEGSAADTPDVDMADIPKPKVSKKTKVNGAEEGQMAAKVSFPAQCRTGARFHPDFLQSKGSRRSSRNKT